MSEINRVLLERRWRRAWVFVFAVGVATLIIAVLGIGIGAVPITPGRVIGLLAAELGIDGWTEGIDAREISRERAIIVAIRLPRVLGAILVGATLGVCGATLQGLFRNPLADPALLGISSTAAMFTTLAIILGTPGWFWVRPVAAFAGSVVATIVVYAIGTSEGGTDVSTMLLAGIAVSSLSSAVTGMLTYVAREADVGTIDFWALGSLVGMTWRSLLIGAPFMLVAPIVLPRLARAFNTFQVGEQGASHLGTNVEVVKAISVGIVALSIGGAVSVSGVIGFVGLVAPHLVRLAIGPDHRTLLPASALLGAALLLVADLAARTVAAPAELQIGLVTAVVGGPFLIWLLLRRRRDRNA